MDPKYPVVTEERNHDFEELKEKKDRIETVLSRLEFDFNRIDIKPGPYCVKFRGNS